MLVTQADLEARLGRALTPEEVTAFTPINQAVQAQVEKIVGSSVEGVEVSTRQYDGGVQNLTISPCTDIAALRYIDSYSNSDYTFGTEDYTAEPVNETMKTWLRNRYGKFNSGYNNVEVTAKFSTYGDTNVTYIIKDGILNALENEINNSENIAKESIEGYSIEYASEKTKQALDKLSYLFAEV